MDADNDPRHVEDKEHDDGDDVDLNFLRSGKEHDARAQALSHEHGSADKALPRQQLHLDAVGGQVQKDFSS